MIRTMCSLAIVFIMTKVLAVVNTSLMDAYLNGAEAKIIWLFPVIRESRLEPLADVG